MLDGNQNPSGSDQDTAGGSSDMSSQTSEETPAGGSQQVSYDTHRKLLSEKKRRDEELREARERLGRFEAEEKKRTEDELLKQQNYEKIIELKNKELEETTQKLSGMQTQFTDMRKFDAFKKALGNGDIDQKYWGLVDLNEIVIHPESTEIDEMSVTKYVDKFQSQFPEVIKRPSGANMPANAPKGVGQTLTYEEWKKLPAKEMRARLKEVRSSQ